MKKADYIFILLQRSIASTRAKLESMSVEKLVQLVGSIAVHEKQLLVQQQIHRKQYTGNVDYNASIHGIPKSYSRDSKIDCLLHLPIVGKFEPNEEQRQMIDVLSLDEPILFLGAGPGSGKTATLVQMVSQLNKQKKKKNILVLMFNVNAEKQFKQRLSSVGVKINPKNKISTGQGIFVCTFHKYAYHSRSTTDGDYDHCILEAVDKSPSKEEVWDYLCVDEAQDLKETYYDLIQTINRKHTIYMGDARQEINNGSHVYSNLIKNSNVRKLHINHRSTSEMVNVLNLCSRSWFSPSIDIQQQGLRSIVGSVEIIQTSDEPETVAKYVASLPPGSTYVISPVTINKFEIESVTTAIRQELYERGRRIITLESGRSIIEDEDIITNAKLVKGLERDQVIVYGVSNTAMYSNYNVPTNCLKCLLYVALSRARKKLVIVINPDNYQSPNLLDPLLEMLGVEHQPKRGETSKRVVSNPVPTINVCDLSEYDFYPTKIGSVDIEKIDIDRRYIEDCAGYYVEAHLASTFGVLSNRYLANRVGSRQQLTYMQDGVYCCDLSTRNMEVDRLFAELNSSKDTPEYTYTRAMYISRIGRDWTVSESLQNHKLDVSSIHRDLRSILGNDVHHSKKHHHTIPMDRSNLPGGYVLGEFDLASNNAIVEIKHAQDIPKHWNQASIYSSISGLPTYIVNTFEGKLWGILPTIADFNRYVRAILVLREAQLSRVGSKVPLKDGLIVSIDTEFIRNDVYEVGAVCINTIDAKVVSTYQDLSGCVPDPNHERSTDPFTRLTGLQITNKPSKDLIGKFQQWLRQYPSATVIQWGGCDSDLLQIPKNRCLDLLSLYRIHVSQQSSTGRSRTTNLRLCDAVQDIFPPGFPFAAHRAFEDALLTAAVYYALLKPR